MKRNGIIISLLLAGLLMLPPNSLAQNMNYVEMNLTGTWDSPEWGLMELIQLGNKLTGLYTHDDGQISGNVDGQNITFTWWEKTVKGMPYKNAEKGQRGEGYFQISDDGNFIKGEWRYEGSQNWDGQWSARRKFTRVNLNGKWNSPEWGMMEFKQNGEKITGRYDYDGGQIAGELKNNRITFRWWEKTPAGEPYEIAPKGERGDGYFDVSADGRTLSGEWKYEGSSGWNGSWTAKKQ